MFQKQLGKKPLLLRNKEPIDLNQPEPSQIENAKQKVRLNLNQFVGIQSVRMQLF